jgi:probable selenium-dependent hydroxylase accessory protein YqeC
LTAVLPVRLDALADALSLGAREVVALVGGGGKTSTLFALGRTLPGRTVLTTTTKMGSDRTEGHRPLLDPADGELADALLREGCVLAWRAIEDHRAVGFAPDVIDRWSSLADHVVVEADGSRRRPFKAPAAHEPVVPGSTTVLVACVGAEAFGAPVADACHRPERVAALTGGSTADPLDPAALARALVHPGGSRKGCPPGARFVVALHRVTPDDAAYVEELSVQLGPAVELVSVAPAGP